MKTRILMACISIYAMTGPSLAEEFNNIGLNFCVAPTRPICIDNDGTYKSAVKMDICEKDLGTFTKATYDFRACLIARGQSAFLAANKTIDVFKEKKASSLAGRKP